ncbi:transcriptional regulator [Actinokineospora sp. NBRC 105648]|nr:transcriptional regulator [Actinokineospora sp. NBRC 105648]
MARARKAAGYTQDDLAEALHIDRSTVHRWESGRSEPLPYIRPKLARLLGLTAAQLEDILAGTHPDDVVASGSTTGMGQFDSTSPNGAARVAGTDHQLAALVRRWVGEMNRRELLQLLGLGAVTAGSPELLDLDDQERVARAVATPARVDERVIENLRAVYWACRRQDDALGPQAVLPTVSAQLKLVRAMLDDCPSPLRPRLLSTYGGLSDLAGWLYTDIGDYTTSWQHFERAREIAHEARDPALSGFVLGRMSHTALAQDKIHLAIDFAEASRKVAERSDDALVRAYAASETAKAYAKDGQVSPCLEAVEEVEQRMGEVDAQPAASSSLAYFYDNGSVGSAKAKCFLALGRPHDAAAEARTALAQHEKSLVRDNAFTMLYLANAHIQLREPDAAALIMGDVIEATTQNRSVRLLERLHGARSALKPWNDADAVKTLDEQLRA